ncbi:MULTISPECIES: aspartate/glutamate racemase family protein [Limosilactobacillus]|jgi:aspartate racemase|uniref:Amino acid racemase n=1 Tax=Limosilactobacillus pontis TaxID=35787 RepID=A0ABU7SS73_9LACO|nr:amino acid racemase [Limosilactobacillus pontis]MCX2186989.1 amino acid racemase [Limosilactobacillus pontis]MCX2189023.1 amino acid racemase [Limosilactobacillus pontis]QFV00499.1 amino acid racemase [Limosilactobacillus pontis]
MKQFFTVLGGMGTLATESYVRILDARTPIHRDQDYLNYIVVNHATVPDRTSWILDHSKPDYNLDLIEDIKQQSLLNPAFFVLICNTAHYAFDKLQAATNIPILNMLQETVNAIKKIKPDAKKVGLLATRGTVTAGLYDHYITDAGYEEIKPTPEILDMTEDLIYHDIKESGHSDGAKYHELVRRMIEEQGADIVILGCTELSYAEEMNPETKYPVADSQSIIVDRSLEKGLALRQNK